MLLHVIYFIHKQFCMHSDFFIFLEVMKLWNFLWVMENLIAKLSSSLLDNSKYSCSDRILK